MNEQNTKRAFWRTGKCLVTVGIYAVFLAACHSYMIEGTIHAPEGIAHIAPVYTQYVPDSWLFTGPGSAKTTWVKRPARYDSGLFRFQIESGDGTNSLLSVDPRLGILTQLNRQSPSEKHLSYDFTGSMRALSLSKSGVIYTYETLELDELSVGDRASGFDCSTGGVANLPATGISGTITKRSEENRSVLLRLEAFEAAVAIPVSMFSAIPTEYRQSLLVEEDPQWLNRGGTTIKNGEATVSSIRCVVYIAPGSVAKNATGNVVSLPMEEKALLATRTKASDGEPRYDLYLVELPNLSKLSEKTAVDFKPQVNCWPLFLHADTPWINVMEVSHGLRAAKTNPQILRIDSSEKLLVELASRLGRTHDTTGMVGLYDKSLGIKELAKKYLGLSQQ